jgi:putative glutamine amidotransferase|tara:strand:+ start:1195 stop:1929 length:735 start_codon:yes stop_codon:yes gene_type:complete
VNQGRLKDFKMLVAISQREVKKDDKIRDNLENDYVKYYESFGLKLIPIPNTTTNIAWYFENLPIEGVILTGGGDVNPELYNQKPKYEINLSMNRDEIEKKLLNVAIEKNLPVLTECRGTQFLNVFFGGSLMQSIKEELRSKVEHVNVTHKIIINDERASTFFNKKELEVNSFHNQGFTKENLSKELKIFAESEDGIVEGVYHKRYPIAGVLWHPERANSDKEFDKNLIQSFIDKKLFWESSKQR